ncbi:GSCFA domain-containing protein [Porphyromonadaceae bacterium W3.11]|nr:GSCFA domain-containing protein [Porphyromonadaceae bacterium W3.11]
MFSYHLEIPKHHTLYDRKDKMVLWGSCFAQELMRSLYEDLFDVKGSPFGIMYNPLSMASGVHRVLHEDIPCEDELFFHLNEWHSFMHHSNFSNANKDLALRGMVQSYRETCDSLKDTSLLVLTFGTAFVYEHLKTGAVVNNCHKLPNDDYFSRRRLKVKEIVDIWTPIISDLRRLNSQLEVLFTVSPICHYRDGAHDNRLSKAILHLAIDELCKLPAVHYFPSYEIMQDELREYRFYKDDFAHPNDLAISYIINRFYNAYIDEEGEAVLSKEWHSIRGMLRHKPLTTHLPTIRGYYESIQERLIHFSEKMSHPYLEEQLEYINKKLEEL